MAFNWESVGKSPITLVCEELARRYVPFDRLSETLVRYGIMVEVDGEEQDLAVNVLFRNSSLFFSVDLLIECPEDMEILANVAGISYDLYTREKPFYGRILVKDNGIYYQLNHIPGTSTLLDPAMVALLLDLVETEVLEIITEEFEEEEETG